MVYATPDQRSFHPIAGHTVRAEVEGGALSSDFGVLLCRGIDRQLGRTARLAAVIHDTRHPSSIPAYASRYRSPCRRTEAVQPSSGDHGRQRWRLG